MADNERDSIEERDIVETGIDPEFIEKMPRRFQRRRPRQVVPDYVDWKDVDYLKQYVPERGKIMPRRISGVASDCQRRIARAIKRARNMALLPYTTD